MLKWLASSTVLAAAILASPGAQAQAARAVQAERWMVPTGPIDGSYYAYDPTTYLVITNVGARAAHLTIRVYNRGQIYGPFPQGTGQERYADELVGVSVPPGGTFTFRNKIAYSDFQVVLSDEPVVVTAWMLRGVGTPGGGAFMPTDAIALSCSGENAGALACSAPLTALAPPPALAGGVPRARQAARSAIAPGEPR